MLSDVEVARLRAAVGEQPKPVWFSFECARCANPFRAQQIAWICPPCWSAGALPLNGGGFSGC